MNNPNEPLSDTEIHVLDEFLMSESTPEDMLSIDELHGFLTAIVCCPVPVNVVFRVEDTMGNPETRPFLQHCRRGRSPLMANIYLHAFDKMWQQSKLPGTLVRYCDDFVILLHPKTDRQWILSQVHAPA